MATLSLRISLEGGRVTKTIQFDPNTSVFDACRIIRDKFAEAVQGDSKCSPFIIDPILSALDQIITRRSSLCL